jgi:sodium transport system ATP-binding protein
LKLQGRCILFSSHVMQEVAALCDRVVILGHGQVLAEGTLEALRSRLGAASLEEAFLKVLGEAPGLVEGEAPGEAR